MAEQEFKAERLNSIQIVATSTTTAFSSLISREEEERLKKSFAENKKLLVVPRRPAWDENTTADQLHAMERESFTDWRRRLATLEEKFILTPFEKNLEIWRQLWRVVERSRIVIQIVDARNPLLFRSEDLDYYVTEMGGNRVDARKSCILILNKADFLSLDQRTAWADYFESLGVSFLFFSAKDALEEAEAEAELEEKAKSLMGTGLEMMDEDESEGEESKSLSESDDEKESKSISESDEKTETPSVQIGDKRTRILDRQELYDHLHLLAGELRETEGVAVGEKINIGLTGYPNVGKSSTINALLGVKKVAVAATPGKTKHFQTIPLSADIMLCDCPGLVFPSFATTKGELVVNGILPVDQLRDYVSPADLVASRIPRIILERMYGIQLPQPEDFEDPDKPPTGLELLTEYARMRGFMRSVQGNPDESRAARVILKDYVTGKLLYCHSPPGMEEKAFNDPFFKVWLEKNVVKSNANDTESGIGAFTSTNSRKVPPARRSDKVDDDFFKQKHVKVHTKGKMAVSDFKSRGLGSSSNSSSLAAAMDNSSAAKVGSKKHFKKNRKTKARNAYESYET